MASESIQESSRPPIDVAIDRLWRFFCSVRAAISEIALLALLVLIGTLHGSVVPENLANWLPFTGGMVERWYAWDVFKSPLFGGLLALISIAIAICTINRVPGIWQTISHPKIRTSAGYLERAELSGTIRPDADIENTSGQLANLLRGKRYRVITEQHNGETHLYADKNRFSKMATFPFHLALILLLVGGIVSSYYGFREREFVIPEGTTREVGHGTGLSVHLNRIEDTYTQVGIASQFRSNVDIFSEGDRIGGGDITVNHPISENSATFYQSGFGNTAQVQVADSTGNVLYAGMIDLGIFTYAGNSESPAGFALIPGTDQIITVVAPDIDPFNQPEKDVLKLQSGQLWVQIQPKTGMTGDTSQLPRAVVNLNEPGQVGNYTVTFFRESRYTVLQVAYNPGIPIFMIASVLLLAGLLVTFYLPLRRIRGMIVPTPEGAMVRLVPLARRDWGGKRDFLDIMSTIETALATTAEIKKPERLTEWAGMTSTSVTSG